MLDWVFLGIAVVLVAFGGLMAALDSALGSRSRNDLEQLADSARFAPSIRAVASDPAAHLNAINFVRIASETTAAVVVTLVVVQFTGNLWWSLLLAALIMSAVSFAIVGVSPRSVGRAHAELMLRWFAPLIRVIRVLLGPIARLLELLGNRVTPGRARGVGVASERELLSVVDEATASDVLEEADRRLIRSVLEFDDTVVREVMVPRTDMVTIDAEASLDDAAEEFFRAGVSRMPVVGEDIDEISQVLYLRDVARARFLADVTASVPSVARPASLVPESMKLDALLQQMQAEHIHLALVVDEYGGTAGLVTLEDLIEELVGDIADEYDRQASEVTDLGDGRYRVSARLAVDELGDLFGLELDDDDVDTVGGLLSKELGRLAQLGDSVEVSGLVLRAVEVHRRRRLVSVEVEAGASLRDAREGFGSEPSA